MCASLVGQCRDHEDHPITDYSRLNNKMRRSCSVAWWAALALDILLSSAASVKAEESEQELEVKKKNK